MRYHIVAGYKRYGGEERLRDRMNEAWCFGSPRFLAR